MQLIVRDYAERESIPELSPYSDQGYTRRGTLPVALEALASSCGKDPFSRRVRAACRMDG